MMIWAVFALCQLPAVCFAGLADYPTLAILPFDKKASVSPEITLKDVTIANEIVYDELVNSGYFDVVERERLDAVCDEPILYDESSLEVTTPAEVQQEKYKKYQTEKYVPQPHYQRED